MINGRIEEGYGSYENSNHTKKQRDSYIHVEADTSPHTWEIGGRKKA